MGEAGRDEAKANQRARAHAQRQQPYATLPCDEELPRKLVYLTGLVLLHLQVEYSQHVDLHCACDLHLPQVWYDASNRAHDNCGPLRGLVLA